MKTHILNFLSENGWVKRPQLLGYLYRCGINTTDRAMRATIEEMVVKDQVAIASSEKGYSLIKNRFELNEAVLYMDAKAHAIAVRKNCLTRNFDNQHKKQLTLL